MCRWLAYLGPPTELSAVVIRPDHSLIDQSLRARQSQHTTNGDGFGVAWYTRNDGPRRYRSTHPAWNDPNLRDLADQVRSPLFMAHVRAATGTAVQYTNCHPFHHEEWLFQHNGLIPDFQRVKRSLLLEIAPELFPHIAGSTDSELLFHLAVTYGLRNDPPTALARMIGLVEDVREQAGIDDSLFATLAVSDGERIYALRYSSCKASRTLFHSRHIHALHDVDGAYGTLPAGAVVVVSEPLDELAHHWEEVPESTLIVVADGQVTRHAFVPAKGT